MNVMGFASNLKTNSIEDFINKINMLYELFNKPQIKISKLLSETIFEIAITNCEADDIYLTESRSGTIITMGEGFPLFETPLILSDKLVKFTYGETANYFAFQLMDGGKTVRTKFIDNGIVVFEKGPPLNIEKETLEKPEQTILTLMQEVCGDDLNSLAPESLSFKYKFLGNR